MFPRLYPLEGKGWCVTGRVSQLQGPGERDSAEALANHMPAQLCSARACRLHSLRKLLPRAPGRDLCRHISASAHAWGPARDTDLAPLMSH